MEEKYRWHYNDEEFLKYARESVNNAMLEFDYKTFITPHNETRELIGRIIEEFQYLEACIKHLIQCAVENNIYIMQKQYSTSIITYPLRKLLIL